MPAGRRGVASDAVLGTAWASLFPVFIPHIWMCLAYWVARSSRAMTTLAAGYGDGALDYSSFVPIVALK
jgi:hypothetical protein